MQWHTYSINDLETAFFEPVGEGILIKSDDKHGSPPTKKAKLPKELDPALVRIPKVLAGKTEPEKEKKKEKKKKNSASCRTKTNNTITGIPHFYPTNKC